MQDTKGQIKHNNASENQAGLLTFINNVFTAWVTPQYSGDISLIVGCEWNSSALIMLASLHRFFDTDHVCTEQAMRNVAVIHTGYELTSLAGHTYSCALGYTPYFFGFNASGSVEKQHQTGIQENQIQFLAGPHIFFSLPFFCTASGQGTRNKASK